MHFFFICAGYLLDTNRPEENVYTTPDGHNDRTHLQVCDVLEVADPGPAPAPHAATHQTTAQQHAAAEFEKTESPPQRGGGFLLVEMNFGI